MSHLPVQSTSFVGRSTEIEDISSMLAQDDCRLVTIVGAGGMGKTRLAIATAEHLADRYPDGVYFVDLAAVKTVDGIVTATASVVGYNFIQDDFSPLQQLLRYFHEKHLLLILDNYEHLLDGAEIVDEYLTLAQQIEIIITSREPLNLDWEWLYQLRGLPYPQTADIDIPENYSALTLFRERARRTQRTFDLDENLAEVVRICHLVEGMPLALEMAAAWLNRVSSTQLADEIEKNIDILTSRSRNVPDRHQSIRAVFDYSWGLLSEAERDVLVKLAVFRGGFTAEAAEAVAGATIWILSSLVDRSMVRRSEAGRFDLHPLMVQYLTELIDSERLAETRCHHATYYYELFETNGVRILYGEFFDEMLGEFDNLIQAWYWLVDNNRADELATVTSFYMEMFIGASNRMLVAEEIFTYAKAHFEPMSDDKDVARALAWILLALGAVLNYGFDQPYDQLQVAAYQFALQSGDKTAIVFTGANVPDKADAIYEQALRELETRPRTPMVDYAIVHSYIEMALIEIKSSYEAALKYLQMALEITQANGYSLLLERNLIMIATVYTLTDYLQEAELYFLEALELAEKTRHIEDTYFCHSGLRDLYVISEKFEQARYYNERCREFYELRNQTSTVRDYYQFEAMIERDSGNNNRAIEMFKQCLEFMASYSARYEFYANTHSELAWTLFVEEHYESGQRHLTEAVRYLRRSYKSADKASFSGFIVHVGAEIVLNYGIVALHDGNLSQATELIALADRFAQIAYNPYLQRKTNLARLKLQPYFPERNVVELLENLQPLTDYNALLVEIRDTIDGFGAVKEERPQPIVETISEREFDVLELLATGASNRDIARELFITLGTVKRHVHNISGKLGAENRTQVALKAKELGLV